MKRNKQRYNQLTMGCWVKKETVIECNKIKLDVFPNIACFELTTREILSLHFLFSGFEMSSGGNTIVHLLKLWLFLSTMQLQSTATRGSLWSAPNQVCVLSSVGLVCWLQAPDALKYTSGFVSSVSRTAMCTWTPRMKLFEAGSLNYLCSVSFCTNKGGIFFSWKWNMWHLHRACE